MKQNKNRLKNLSDALGRMAKPNTTKTDIEQLVTKEITDIDEVLRELSNEGFTSYSSGRGPWINDEQRIINELAIKHPEGRIVAISEYKSYAPSGNTIRSYPQRSDFQTPDIYQEHVEKWQLQMEPDMPLVLKEST